MIFYLLLIVQLIVVCQGELTIKAVKEYNIVEMNTPLKLSCEISGLENETHAVVIEWKNIISNETITSHTTGYMVDVGSFADGKRVTTLSLDGNVNTEDTVYGCGVKDAIDKDYKVAEFTIYLFEVEAKHQVVNVSTPATLACYFTDIIKNLTVTWQEKGSQANLSTVEEASRKLLIFQLLFRWVDNRFVCDLWDDKNAKKPSVAICGGLGNFLLYIDWTIIL